MTRGIRDFFVKGIKSVSAGLCDGDGIASGGSADGAMGDASCDRASSDPVSQEAEYPPSGHNVSRREFVEKYASAGLKNDIRSVAILYYVCSAATFIFSCIINPIGVIDAVVLAGVALGMHLSKSKVCAVLLLILSIAEFVLSVPSSYPFWWIIGGIYTVMTFRKIDKEYAIFRRERI